MSTTQEPDCGSSSCIFSANGGMRTNGPCRCYENAGFHGSAVMAARQMLPELLKLRAAHAWIKTSERMPDPEVVVLVVSTQDYAEGEVCTAKCYTSTSGALVWEHYSSETGEAGMDIESVYVTHWQPLPEPPK